MLAIFHLREKSIVTVSHRPQRRLWDRLRFKPAVRRLWRCKVIRSPSKKKGNFRIPKRERRNLNIPLKENILLMSWGTLQKVSRSLKCTPRKGSNMNHLAQKEAVNTGQTRGNNASWLLVFAHVLLPHHRPSCHLTHHSRADSWEVCQGVESGQMRR